LVCDGVENVAREVDSCRRIDGERFKRRQSEDLLAAGLVAAEIGRVEIDLGREAPGAVLWPA
jgi:hypothetical protein